MPTAEGEEKHKCCYGLEVEERRFQKITNYANDDDNDY
jgi:hypothetical protein